MRPGASEVGEIQSHEIVAVTVDVEMGQPVRVPDELREAVAAFEGGPVYS